MKVALKFLRKVVGEGEAVERERVAGREGVVGRKRPKAKEKGHRKQNQPRRQALSWNVVRPSRQKAKVSAPSLTKLLKMILGLQRKVMAVCGKNLKEKRKSKGKRNQQRQRQHNQRRRRKLRIRKGKVIPKAQPLKPSRRGRNEALKSQLSITPPWFPIGVAMLALWRCLVGMEVANSPRPFCQVNWSLLVLKSCNSKSLHVSNIEKFSWGS